MSRSFGDPFFKRSAQFLAFIFCSTEVRLVGDWSNAIFKQKIKITEFCFDDWLLYDNLHVHLNF